MPLVNFPRVDDPTVSVIVLAWRQTDRLVACLSSLAESADGPSFEVVIVLNGAAAEVRRVVEAQISGATVVSVEQNLGFGGGCNIGVASSRGRQILFLNDDVTVDPGMLAALSAHLDRDPGIAATAAVLLNPDGSLQEAGSRILSSGGTVQLGAGLPINSNDASSFLTEREIDYGSAAALLVTRKAFDDVGGFDPVYEPAYFEDVDLALRLKEHGGRVTLEPRARATHATGSSTATDTRFRQFAADHAGSEFAARWGDILPLAADRDAEPERVLPVPPSDRPPVLRSESTPAATAGSIASNYATWLGAQLDRLESDRATREADLRAAEAEIETLRNCVASLNSTAHGLKERLDDLEARGPIGVVKWQLGLVKLRHARNSDE